MRINVDSLAEDYFLTVYESFEKENAEVIKACKDDFKAGFNKCLELVKPLLDKAIDALNTIDDLEFNQLTPELQEFLEKYKT